MQAGTILIVDDNKSVLTSLELLLEDEFEGVETASNPNSILSVLDSRPVDLVLLDMKFALPELILVMKGFSGSVAYGRSHRNFLYHADCLRGCRVGS